MTKTVLGMRVPTFRKAAKTVSYPRMFATDTDIAAATSEEHKKNLYLFNCAMRAHYNFMENYNSALPALLIAGLKFPLTAALAGAAWTAFRVMYAVGYTRADKDRGQGRLVGSGFWACQFILYVQTALVGYSLLV